MLVEVNTFRLAAGADEARFLVADERVQQEFAPFRPGFVRRTTARGDAGEWAVVTLWDAREHAVAAEQAAASHPAATDFLALVDPASCRVARYDTLD